MIFDLEKFTGKTALIAGEKIFTYGQLKAASEEISGAAGSRCLIFLYCTNSFAGVAGYVGFMNGGQVPMMLDADLDVDLAKNLLALYRPKFLWLPENLRDDYSDCEKIFERDGYVLLATNAETFPLNENLALLMTTSGSTGSPKFVRQSYENILANTKSIVEYLGIDESDRSITNLPINYVYGLSILNTHLHAGGSIVLTEKTLFQKEFWQALKNNSVTNLNGVPYTFEMLQRLRFFRMDLPALKKITQAGGKLDPESHFKFAEYAQNTGRKFFVMYGAAEATARMGYLPAENSLQKVGCMGVAIPGGRFELVDADGKTIFAQDKIGELIYYGDNVTLGYAERGEDLILGDERHKRLETGDLAKFDGDGYFTIVGRKKRFLKMFGKRVNLQEVEHIVRQNFNLSEVAAAGVDDKMYVFVTDKNLLEEIGAYLSKKISVHPTALKIKFIAEIPKNSSGKIIYSELENFYDL